MTSQKLESSLSDARIQVDQLKERSRSKVRVLSSTSAGCVHACVYMLVCVCLCVYACVCMLVCVCLCVYACVCMLVCVCLCVYACVCMLVCVCLCVYACVCMLVCVCLCVYACVCMPVCVCMLVYVCVDFLCLSVTTYYSDLVTYSQPFWSYQFTVANTNSGDWRCQ